MAQTAGKASTRAEKSAAAGKYDERVEVITRVAVRLFAEKGYEATSINDLAAAVGLLKGSLYYYVPSKEKLLLDILSEVQRAGSEILAETELRKSQGEGFEAQIRTFVELGCEFTLTHKPQVAVYFRSFNSLDKKSQRKLLKERQVYERALLQLIRDGQADGTFEASVPASVIVTAVHALVNWLALSPAPAPAEKELAPSALAKSYADLLLGGVIRTS